MRNYAIVGVMICIISSSLEYLHLGPRFCHMNCWTTDPNMGGECTNWKIQGKAAIYMSKTIITYLDTSLLATTYTPNMGYSQNHIISATKKGEKNTKRAHKGERDPYQFNPVKVWTPSMKYCKAATGREESAAATATSLTTGPCATATSTLFCSTISSVLFSVRKSGASEMYLILSDPSPVMPDE